MRGVTLISTVELIQEALYRVNRRLNLHMTYRAMVILVVVYKAEVASGDISQNQIVERLFKTHNHYTEMATLEQLRRLVEKGFLYKKKEGRINRYTVTLQGSNYIRMFERTLRDVRQKF